MAKTKDTETSAHAELSRLRALTADERMKQRDLAHRLDVARDKAAQAEQAIDQGYAIEDEQAITTARESLRDAELEADDLGHRIRAAEGRVSTSQALADRYVEKHADDLIAEEVARAEYVVRRLSAAVGEVVGLHRQLISSRTEQDRLIAASHGEPRTDGPEPVHPWERALLELERTVKENPELGAPKPRWHGRQAAEERDRVHAQLQEQRG
jgi:hypothetical protein